MTQGQGSALPSVQGSAPASDPASESAPGSMAEPAFGGLKLLGSSNAVVCEGDVCWVPPTNP